MKETYFITGISTEVGKTISAAIVTEALEADYWKPVQAGDLDHSDTHKVKDWVKNPYTVFHTSAIALQTPMSPHAAAEREDRQLTASQCIRPKTENTLVIEGAGGVLVPLNATETIVDLIQPSDKVILVSRHYLGSINHTLLSVEALQARGLNVFGIIFSGDEHPSTETIILEKTRVPMIGRIREEKHFDRSLISQYAKQFRDVLSTT
tara:strand:+ start:3224 stop:3847 length:624 start_codon:yes stop_codon:yes gene_type:complete